MGIGIIVLLVIATVLGFIIGLCKGFHNVKSWGIDYLLATFVTIGLGGLIGKGFNVGDEGTGAYGVVTLVIAVVMILLFGLTSTIFRKVFKSSKRRKIANGGKKKGPSGFFDSVFGGVTLAAKGFVIAGVSTAFGLVVLDLAQIAAINELMGDIYSHASWAAFKPLLMDFFYMGALMAAIRSGYKGGISNFLWTVCVIAMVAFSAYISYHLAFEVEAFQGAVNSLAAVFAGENAVGDTQLMLGKAALTGGLFLLMLVVVILIGVFVPKLLTAARNGSAFYVIDGIFGALFAFLVVAGLLMFLGTFVQPISNGEEFAFMAKFSSYFETSKIATFFYDKNIMIMYGMQPLIPIKDWLTK